MFRNISLGVIIAIILIIYWWQKDHAVPAQPVRQGSVIEQTLYG